jgi:multisubunit Na+/H+ antiporter MnhB subunit
VIEIILLLTFVLIAAVVAVEIRSLLSAVVALGVVGFALCVIFFLLRAPDVAITQLVVEVLILVLLIRATGVKQDMTEYRGGLLEVFAVVSVLFFIFIFGLFGVWALHHVPKFGEPLMTVSQTYIEQGLSRTGAANLVSGVLLDFRAYDTLGEATVLFTAVIGALAVLRRKGRKKLGERDDSNS